MVHLPLPTETEDKKQNHQNDTVIEMKSTGHNTDDLFWNSLTDDTDYTYDTDDTDETETEVEEV